MAGKGRIENLRPPWKPGQSGNPSGRPKNRPISDSYDALAQMPAPEELRCKLGLWKGATLADAAALALFMAASAGSVPAAREIREGIEGTANERPSQVVAQEVVLNVVEELRLRKNFDGTPVATRRAAALGTSSNESPSQGVKIPSDKRQ